MKRKFYNSFFKNKLVAQILKVSILSVQINFLNFKTNMATKEYFTGLKKIEYNPKAKIDETMVNK